MTTLPSFGQGPKFRLPSSSDPRARQGSPGILGIKLPEAAPNLLTFNLALFAPDFYHEIWCHQDPTDLIGLGPTPRKTERITADPTLTLNHPESRRLRSTECDSNANAG
jgi:hypothetical protein